MKKFMKEALLWGFILIPYVYLAVIYPSLPDVVPTHFNLQGVANDWSSKSMFLYFPAVLGIGVYLLMLVIPRIDSKQQLHAMGQKYYYLRLILTGFISVLTVYILFSVKEGSVSTPQIFFGFIGLMFAVMGNYFQATRPNYFIGIRTPWTLESESVWRKTHRMGGRLWMIGGTLIILFMFLIDDLKVLEGFFLTTVVLLSLVPIIYSYIVFQQEKKLSKDVN